MPPVLAGGVPVSETVFDVERVEELVLERETTGGVVWVASGSLPAAFANVTSKPAYTQSVRYLKDYSIECAYGPIRIRPVWD